MRIGLIEMKRPPSRLNLDSAIFIGLEWWSSAVPIMTNSLRALQVRAAELPEGAADGVDHAGGHVDRAEAAVRRVVGGAELARKQAGQGLHLVAAGEEGELLRVGGAQVLEARLQRAEGLFPGDFLELAVAALGAGLAPQRLGQARRRILLHDAGRTLGADHALVQRVLRVAFDVTDLAIAQVHPDAAAAGTHIASGVAGLVGGPSQRRGFWIVQRDGCHPLITSRLEEYVYYRQG